MHMKLTRQVDVLMLCICIQDVSVSNLGHIIRYPDWDFVVVSLGLVRQMLGFVIKYATHSPFMLIFPSHLTLYDLCS
jgi:hypothetical protein